VPHASGGRAPPADMLLQLDAAVVRAELAAARLRSLVEERDRLRLPTGHTREALAAAERHTAVLVRRRRMADRGAGPIAR
jgi:hypothetical protein